MKLVEGQLIHSRYRLDRRLAQGGMGEVWKGYDIQLNKVVAIKALRGDVKDVEAKLRRLRMEAHNSANLAHPNIAALFDYYEHDGIGFLIMEYVPSDSLADLYRKKGAMDPLELLPILVQVARGLYVAHSHGVIHRDVKPANIMVSEDGEVKITDFGVSYSTNQAQITQDGMVVGTAQYISPEQAQGKQATPQSDIYSLGVVAYEGLCGHRPFTGATPVDIAAAHVNDAVPPLPDTVDVQLNQFVMSMLSKDPRDRPKDALVVSRTLSRIERRLMDQQAALNDATIVSRDGRIARRVVSAPYTLDGAVAGGRASSLGSAFPEAENPPSENASSESTGKRRVAASTGNSEKPDGAVAAEDFGNAQDARDAANVVNAEEVKNADAKRDVENTPDAEDAENAEDAEDTPAAAEEQVGNAPRSVTSGTSNDKSDDDITSEPDDDSNAENDEKPRKTEGPRTVSSSSEANNADKADGKNASRLPRHDVSEPPAPAPVSSAFVTSDDVSSQGIFGDTDIDLDGDEADSKADDEQADADMVKPKHARHAIPDDSPNTDNHDAPKHKAQDAAETSDNPGEPDMSNEPGDSEYTPAAKAAMLTLSETLKDIKDIDLSPTPASDDAATPPGAGSSDDATGVASDTSDTADKKPSDKPPTEPERIKPANGEPASAEPASIAPELSKPSSKPEPEPTTGETPARKTSEENQEEQQ